MNMPKHTLNPIFFDLDGTLLNTAPDISYAMSKTLQERGLSMHHEIDQNYYLFGSSCELLALLLDLSMEDPTFKAIREEFFSHYLDNIAERTHFYNYIDTTLKLLIEHDIPWGIITNKPSRLTDKVIEAFPLLQEAKICLSGDSLPNPKPSPEPLLHACQSLNLSPSQCSYVGDTHTDCLAAQRAGMQSIAVLYGYHKPTDNPTDWKANLYFDSGQGLYEWVHSQLNNNHKDYLE